jgi:glutamate 5-kinase
VKAGTTVLTNGTRKLDETIMDGLVKQIALLHENGAEILLVTSGAIAAGRESLGGIGDLPDVHHRQVLAAVGQNHLMNTYTDLFEKHGLGIAQVLLTRDDLHDSQRSKFVLDTLETLLKRGIVPIVNENDVVAIDEIGDVFGDNDMLSAILSSLVNANLLAILTDSDGLMTKDPRLDSSAKRVPVVKVIDNISESIIGEHHNPWSRGGMRTKIEAARIATRAGATVIICDGRVRDVICKLDKGEDIGTIFVPS